jgi:DNA-binding NarL/FixJ family response regulator
MPQPEPQDITHSSTSRTPRSRILVIDDGDSVRDVIGVFLENAGFEVCGEAADGVEGIEQAQKLKPDLVVLDLAMPRMNGVEAAFVLRKTMPTIPVVMLTMYQNMLGPSLASALGIKAVIDKTDGLDKLVACVHSLLKIESAPASAQS